jgi:hypothetical protein
MNKFSSVILLLFFLSSCASQETIDETLSNYRTKSERRLCLDYLLSSRGNVWQGERLQVINEKNYDCDKYIPAAELEISKRLIE